MTKLWYDKLKKGDRLQIRCGNAIYYAKVDLNTKEKIVLNGRQYLKSTRKKVGDEWQWTPTFPFWS